MPLALRRRLDARQLTQRAKQPDRARQREVGDPVDLLQIPLAGDDRDDQPAMLSTANVMTSLQANV